MNILDLIIENIITYLITRETEEEKKLLKKYEKEKNEEIVFISNELSIDIYKAKKVREQLYSYTVPKIIKINYSYKDNLYHFECERNIKGTFSLDKDDKINYLNVDGVNCLVMKDLRHIK